MTASGSNYRGRLAPTPTGHLHLGHAATFFTAWKRAREAGGQIALRLEDLDPLRCTPAFEQAAIEDLQWLGLDWDGEPTRQSDRRPLYRKAWDTLREKGLLYPCHRSRKDIASFAPHDEEPIFPIGWRNPIQATPALPGSVNWRFRVPDGQVIRFHDERWGHVERTALKDFGDFVVWNRDDIPAYELAVVVDDIAMGITEIVRGEDLLTSTARQILIYEALGAQPPRTYHCPLICDESGNRLAKRNGALSLRVLREKGISPESITCGFLDPSSGRGPKAI